MKGTLEMPTTNKELAAKIQKDYEQRKKASGWKRIALWIHPGADRAKIKKYVDRQNKAAEKI